VGLEVAHPSEELLTARTLAERLKVRPATVLRWARNGELPSIRLPGGAIRFRADVIEDRLDSWSSGPRPASVLSLAPKLADREENHAS